METLENTTWDVVISGTGFLQSLLALALSRSDKKILHVDRNGYYGGEQAALSLSEAEIWAHEHHDASCTPFSNAKVVQAQNSESAGAQLLSSRAYSLALAPQLLYAQAELLQALVSSHAHTQLEFQAVGSWYIMSSPENASSAAPTLTRVPGGREDIFQDEALDLKQKRALMKFLRFVGNHEDHPETWQEHSSIPFTQFLEDQFKLPSSSNAPILALTMSSDTPANTTVEVALANIAKHLRSIGVFGPGFGAVLPKWGGLAEMVQVSCRACAVGGGVYVLGTGIVDFQSSTNDDLAVELSNGDHITAKCLVGSISDLYRSKSSSQSDAPTERVYSKSVSIVSSPLTHLFPSTSEGGVIPAGAVIFVPGADADDPPVYVLVHSSEAGECPSGQCVLYASVAQTYATGFDRLAGVVSMLVDTASEQPKPQVLWTMSYEQRFVPGPPLGHDLPSNVIVLPSLSPDLALDGDVLDPVKRAWQQITGAELETFMKFESREHSYEESQGDE